jgi:hypothetical protein
MTKQIDELVTMLESIFINNHPDHRASGYTSEQLIAWGLRMGLITEGDLK